MQQAGNARLACCTDAPAECQSTRATRVSINPVAIRTSWRSHPAGWRNGRQACSRQRHVAAAAAAAAGSGCRQGRRCREPLLPRSGIIHALPACEAAARNPNASAVRGSRQRAPSQSWHLAVGSTRNVESQSPAPWATICRCAAKTVASSSLARPLPAIASAGRRPLWKVIPCL